MALWCGGRLQVRMVVEEWGRGKERKGQMGNSS